MTEKLSFKVFDKFNKPVKPGANVKDPTSLILRVTNPEESGPEPVGHQADTPAESLQEIKRRLGQFTPAKEPPNFKNLLAVPYQKILIVRTDTNSDLLVEDRIVALTFNQGGSLLNARVLRVSEFYNANGEYKDLAGQPLPTKTILIEWEPPAPEFVDFDEDQQGIVLGSQSDNFHIQDPPNNKPGDPIISATEDNAADGYSVKDTTFELFQPDGVMQPVASTDSVVAVIDTGIKTFFGQPPRGTYPDRNGVETPFKLVKVPGSIDYERGYCAVTEYLRASSDSDAVKDRTYRTNPIFSRLTSLSKKDITCSPYDDHLLYGRHQKLAKKGRHGTTITAIINQKGNAAVLPVKTFNNGGNGTLYDVLCGLNYVLYSHEKEVPIRVVNLSFTGALLGKAYDILRKKFVALALANIWAVAAAGNNQKELKLDLFGQRPENSREVWNLFPACFCQDNDLKVITVTSVEVDSYKIVKLVKTPKLAGSISRQKQIAILKSLQLPWQGYYLIPATYRVLYNHSKSLVTIGIVGPFPHIFKNAASDLRPTSFTAAFFSAKLANFLSSNPLATRSQILAHETFSGTIVNGAIDASRLMQFQ